jgi:hypothetical protein
MYIKPYGVVNITPIADVRRCTPHLIGHEVRLVGEITPPSKLIFGSTYIIIFCILFRRNRALSILGCYVAWV